MPAGCASHACHVVLDSSGLAASALHLHLAVVYRLC